MGAASNVTARKISEIIKFAHFNTRKRKENNRKQSMLEEFNKYFSHIGENLATKIKYDNAKTCKLYLHNRIRLSIFMEPPWANEVKNLINSLNL